MLSLSKGFSKQVAIKLIKLQHLACIHVGSNCSHEPEQMQETQPLVSERTKLKFVIDSAEILVSFSDPSNSVSFSLEHFFRSSKRC